MCQCGRWFVQVCGNPLKQDNRGAVGPAPARPGLAGDVYQPCADSFAFLDALEQDRAAILGRRPTICLEVAPATPSVTARHTATRLRVGVHFGRKRSSGNGAGFGTVGHVDLAAGGQPGPPLVRHDQCCPRQANAEGQDG